MFYSHLKSLPARLARLAVGLRATRRMTVDPYSPSEVRYELEEAVRSALKKELKFKENTTFEDRWLLLSFAASSFAIYAAIYSYLNSFNDSKNVLYICVFFYFFFTGILTLHEYFVKKKIIFQGTRKDPLGIDPAITISVSFWLERFSSDVNLEIVRKSKKSILKKSISKWINTQGEIVDSEIITDLKNLLAMKKE